SYSHHFSLNDQVLGGVSRQRKDCLVWLPRSRQTRRTVGSCLPRRGFLFSSKLSPPALPAILSAAAPPCMSDGSGKKVLDNAIILINYRQNKNKIMNWPSRKHE